MGTFIRDTPTTSFYTLSLLDALPISPFSGEEVRFAEYDGGRLATLRSRVRRQRSGPYGWRMRSEEHTSELQSQFHLVCRLLLDKKNKRHAAYARRQFEY